MQDAFAYCAELVRTADRDRFLSSLFAPAEHRAALHALYAFNVEVARVREVAREPLPGEIRLQWWSEVVNGERAEEARRQSGSVRAAHGDRTPSAGGACADGSDRRALLRSLRRPDGAARRSRSLCAENILGAARAFAAQILAGGEARGDGDDRDFPPELPTRSPVYFAHFRCMPRAGSSTCRSSCSSIMGSSRRTYSPADLRKISARRLESCRTLPAATFLLPTNRSRRCLMPHCRLFSQSRWCGRRSTAWRAAIHLRLPSCRHGGGNG